MIWLVGLCGAFGAVMRFLLVKWISRISKLEDFPIGTFLVNITGSFLLGLLANFYQSNQLNDLLWFSLGAGFLGAFTTFSTFAYETLTLILAGNKKIALWYPITSVIISIFAAGCGYLL